MRHVTLHYVTLRHVTHIGSIQVLHEIESRVDASEFYDVYRPLLAGMSHVTHMNESCHTYE